MKQIASTYTYNKTTGEIGLIGVGIDRDQLLLVVNTTRNVTYYNFADSATTLQSFTRQNSFPAVTQFTLNSSVIAASSAHTNQDALIIYYEDQENPGLNELKMLASTNYIKVNINVANSIGATLASSVYLRRIGEYSYESIRYQGGEDEAYLKVYLDDGDDSTQRVWRLSSGGSYADIQGIVAYRLPQNAGSNNGDALPPKTGWGLETGITGTLLISYEQPSAQLAYGNNGLDGGGGNVIPLQMAYNDEGFADGRRLAVSIVNSEGQEYTTPLPTSVNNAGWKLLGSRNWNSDQSVFTIDTTGYSELRFQGYTSGGVTSKIEVLSPTGGEDYFWSFGSTNVLTFNHNLITTNQYVGEMRLEMTDWDPNENQATQVFGRTSVSTITAYPAQGTNSYLYNFTSVTSTYLADTQYGGRTALSVFNDGPGTLYISPKNTVSTSSYMVRLSAGEYWECPNGSVLLPYWAIFGSAGTARVTQIY
jgi:hypothetical protein